MRLHISTVHEGIKRDKIKCERCDRKFYTMYEVKRHIKIDHDGIKKFQCQKCDKAFGEARRLNQHVAIVTIFL